MIRRFYVHNFRCFQSFELKITGQSSILLIGNNGAGKTTVGLALEVLQQIARGNNRVESLVRPRRDPTRWRSDSVVRFEIELDLKAQVYAYTIAFDVPDPEKEPHKEPRVLEERLSLNGNSVYKREEAQIDLGGGRHERGAKFQIDWRLAALPILQEQSTEDPLFIFRRWLGRMLILRPLPALIRGYSQEETLQPNPLVTDFGAWFSGLLAYEPSAYAEIAEYLKEVMPDLKDIKNPIIGQGARSINVNFANISVPFEDLSDGEKCFMISALVLAANRAYGPLLCFWDEPDNYLALSEVGHFVLALRKAFQSGGQFVATSHNPEAIRRFSAENTLVLQRRSRSEPTIVRPLEEMKINGDLVGALIRGDVE